jgi:hypothetical protein
MQLGLYQAHARLCAPMQPDGTRKLHRVAKVLGQSLPDVDDFPPLKSRSELQNPTCKLFLIGNTSVVWIETMVLNTDGC